MRPWSGSRTTAARKPSYSPISVDGVALSAATDLLRSCLRS
jgi:hypothetical protein